MSANTCPILWYENDKGARWYPPRDHGPDDGVPAGFKYQRFRNPFELHDTISTATGGQIFHGTQTYNGPLALALCRPTILQRVIQILRFGWPARTMPLDQAILCAAMACERCMNSTAYRHGLMSGYRVGSKEWQKSNTRCEFCT